MMTQWVDSQAVRGDERSLQFRIRLEEEDLAIG